jgi:glucokinase
VINDAHAALMGEIWRGAARGLDHVVMYTLGTGVGGAIVSSGRLLTGRFGRAGHLGHTSVNSEGEPDLCNTPGSIEDAIGELTLAKRCHGAFGSTEALVEAYAQGDPAASEVWLRSLRALAASIVSLANAVDPEVVLLGGGMIAADEHLFGPLRKLVAEREWRPANARIEVRKADLGTWAGAYGAAYHAARLSQQQQN